MKLKTWFSKQWLGLVSVMGAVVSATILLGNISDHFIFELILYASFLLVIISLRKEKKTTSQRGSA